MIDFKELLPQMARHVKHHESDDCQTSIEPLGDGTYKVVTHCDYIKCDCYTTSCGEYIPFPDERLFLAIRERQLTKMREQGGDF